MNIKKKENSHKLLVKTLHIGQYMTSDFYRYCMPYEFQADETKYSSAVATGNLGNEWIIRTAK